MSNPRQTVVRPSGIVTTPNEYGEISPGTLAQGMNCMMRRQSVLEPRPAFEAVVAVPNVIRMWSMFGDDTDSRILEIRTNGSTSASVTDGALVKGLNISANSFAEGKTQVTHVRGRTIITTTTAPRVIDPQDVPPISYTQRKAGIPMPAWIDIDISTTSGAPLWLLQDNITAYRALYKRKFEDNYIVTGAVSIPIASNIAAGDCLPQVSISALGNFDMQAGDLIELYRVKQQTNVDLLGDNFMLSLVHEITSSEATNGVATFYDPILDDQLGEKLYTNEAEQGASKNNYMPPPSDDVCTFKGATFYVSREEWHTVTVKLPPMVSVAGETLGWGGPRAGISGGVTTLGSPNITGVASVAGLAAGQLIESATFPPDTYIVSIGGLGPYTIQASANALASVNPFSSTTYDSIEIDGIKIPYISFGFFMETLAGHAADGDFDVVAIPDQIVQSGSGDDGVTLTFLAPISGSDPFTIRASNGNLLSPPLPTGGATPLESSASPRMDRVQFSKIDQPEAVPPDNRLYIGKKIVLRLIKTRDSLYALCTDGIFRIDGDGDQWSVNPYDFDTFLLAPDAVDTMDNVVYALTNRGFVSFSDSSRVEKLSAERVDEEFRALEVQLRDKFPFTWTTQIFCDRHQGEVWINFNDYTDDSWLATWVWNVNTSTFLNQDTVEMLTGVYLPLERNLYTSDAAELKKYSSSAVMSPVTVVFNPVVADDLGLLKQWIDVNMFLQDLTEDGLMTPSFEGVDYPDNYTLRETAGYFDHVVPLLRNYVHWKHCKFGFVLEAVPDATAPNWELKGLSYRYRMASDTLTR